MEDDDFPKTGGWTSAPRTFLVERHVADTMATAHWHDHVEVNLLLDGRMTYLFNGRQQQVEAGRMVLFWAAIPHQTIAVTSDAPLVCIYLPLVDFLALPIERASREAIMQGEFVAEPEAQTNAASEASKWVDEWEAGGEARRQLVVDEVKLAIRRLVLDHAEKKGAPNAASVPVTPAIRHTQRLTALINDRFSEALTLASISRDACIHPTTANRAFNDVLGIPVMEYLIRYRLSRAMQQLADTQDPIIDIAHNCGFGSNTRFYDVFRQRVGTTPRQFRLSTRGHG